MLQPTDSKVNFRFKFSAVLTGLCLEKNTKIYMSNTYKFWNINNSQDKNAVLECFGYLEYLASGGGGGVLISIPWKRTQQLF